MSVFKVREIKWLSVSEEMLRNAIPINGGADRAVEHKGELYTFGRSSHQIYTGHITNIDNLFENDEFFNADISYWAMHKLRSMVATFRKAKVFNQPIGIWDTERLEDIDHAFSETDAFDQYLGDWKTDRLIHASFAFENARAFTDKLGGLLKWQLDRLLCSYGILDGTLVDQKTINYFLKHGDY